MMEERYARAIKIDIYICESVCEVYVFMCVDMCVCVCAYMCYYCMFSGSYVCVQRKV